MKLKKMCSLFLALILTFGIVGCNSSSGGKQVSVSDLAIPTYEDAGEMMLRVDLPPNMSSREQMELYKECGFNTIPLTEDFFSVEDVAPYMDKLAEYNKAMEDWDGNELNKPEEPEKPKYIQALELCEELGIDVLIRPHDMIHLSGNYEEVINEPNYFEKYLYNIDFRDYPAVKGFFICDEPVYSRVQDMINRYLPWFNENYGGENYEMFVNHLGPGSMAWKDKYSLTMTYDQFIDYWHENFLSKLNSVNKTYSFDGYFLRNDGTNNYLADSMLRSCMYLKKRADKWGVGFGAYVQCFYGYSNLRDPITYADFSFQVSTYMAFGVNRLSFYGYRDYGTESHLMEGGEPREKWYHVQKINTLIKKLDGIMYNFDWEGLYTNIGTGSFFATNEAFEAVKNDVLKDLDGVKSFKSKYDSIVGQFKDKDGRNAYMLVNYEEPSEVKNNKVTMTFEDADGVMYYRDGEPIIEGLTDRTFTIDLKEGEGVFVIPLYKK